MNTYTVTITDKIIWTTTVQAVGSIEAEDEAWQLFDSNDRSDHFEYGSDTTVRVEQVAPQGEAVA